MGDLIGTSVEGTLYYVPYAAFEDVRTRDLPLHDRIALFADLCRVNTLTMIARAGSGHIGSSFSSLDIVSTLHLGVMREDDLYFSSKGHDAPGLYSVLIGLGKLEFSLLHRLRRKGGLPGHPDVSTPHMVANTGSLGMGISKAKGLVRAHRLRGEEKRVFVMTGDGELQEGQIWESLIGAVNARMHELTVIVDHNKLQSDAFVRHTSDLGDLAAKFRAFGWDVERVDGHDVARLAEALDAKPIGLPRVILADTVKGRGVSFMEHTSLESDVSLYRFHSGAPDAGSYARSLEELVRRIDARCEALGLDRIELETVERPAAPPQPRLERLVPAYSNALVEAGRNDPRIVVLDADLMVDTGLLPAREAFPERFVECGIAEMDMVSQAGGLALGGLLPVCHSFACFLSSRANEHFYTNATERTKVLYVGSLAGCLPGGPGHSHQSVRDISALAAVPGLVMAEPSCEAEVGPLFDYLHRRTTESGYLRLVSVPWPVPFRLPSGYVPELGRGVTLFGTGGRHGIVVSYGLVMLSEAYRAAEALAREGIDVEVVNLPWLNRIDDGWLREIIGARTCVITLDNHYAHGGQGDLVATRCAELGLPVKVTKLGLDEIPAFGTNDEVLAHHGLDAASLARRFRKVTGVIPASAIS